MEGDLANLDDLFKAGNRMMGLTHFFDNEVAGCAHGLNKDGLTLLGRQVFKRMVQHGIVIDLGHLSPSAINDVLSMLSKPLAVSHTGVQRTCLGVINLTDAQFLKIAENVSVVGLGYWGRVFFDRPPKPFIRATSYVAILIGVA
ncbi:membrane dipeptidase [Paraglaciecola sp. 20A4]|uniref:membrane dipeptidase n=1 Tax=Paraglaciecola sp. 20A4 TaxID=2687288 RepID=UPI003211CB9D